MNQCKVTHNPIAVPACISREGNESGCALEVVLKAGPALTRRLSNYYTISSHYPAIPRPSRGDRSRAENGRAAHGRAGQGRPDQTRPNQCGTEQIIIPQPINQRTASQPTNCRPRSAFVKNGGVRGAGHGVRTGKTKVLYLQTKQKRNSGQPIH